MSARRRLLAPLAACLGLVALGGCAAVSPPHPARPATAAVGRSAYSGAPRPASFTPSASPLPVGVNVAAFNALARQEASAWARSSLGKIWKTGLVVPLADVLSSGPSGGFPSSEAKEAFGNGNLVFTGPPPSAAPAGMVTWPDGSNLKVPVLSEAGAFSAMKNNTGGRCPSCVTTPLAVTAAEPTTMKVPTSRGSATVPAWAFTLRGVSTPVIQAALPPGSYITEYSYPAPAENLGPLGKAFVGAAEAAGSAGSRTLTLMLGGSPCDMTWGGLAAEVGDVVVAGGWMHDPHPDAACPASLVTRSVTVRLAAPLGDRVILDAATGLPVAPVPFTGTPVTVR
jgi:hypothetical protein